ncbi:hypothetical protein BOX15_Mlig030923g3, partial [Macrostomum lignano]
AHQSSPSRVIIVLLDTQDIPDADLQVLASGFTEFLCLSANCSGDSPAAICLICLRGNPSAALAVLELQPTSRAVERLLAEGHQLFQFENGQITAAGAGEASEIDVALAIAEQQVKLALLPPSDSAELCLLTRRSATILRLRRSFSSNCSQFLSLLRHCRKIRLLHLPGYAAPKRVPSTTAESSENEAAEQKFDQLVEVTTVRRADPELFLALRAWLLPPSATSSERPSNRLIFPSNGFEKERFLNFRLSEVVLNPGLLSEPAVLDAFQPLFGPPTRLSRLVSSTTELEASNEVHLEACGLASLTRLSPAHLFGWPVLLRPVAAENESVAKFCSLVKLLRQRGLVLLVRRQRRRPGKHQQLAANAGTSTGATNIQGDDATPSASTPTGPAAYFALGPTEHLADALVARGYACDDLLLPVNVTAAAESGENTAPDTGSSVDDGHAAAGPVFAPGDEADAKVFAALNAIDSLEQWTPHDLACHWGQYLAGRAVAAAARAGREK